MATKPGEDISTRHNGLHFAVVTLGVLDDSVDLGKADDWNYR